MKGEKVTIYVDKLVFEHSGEIFTLRGDVLNMITDYKDNTTDSRDAKQVIGFMHEMRFDIHSWGKILRDKSLIQNYFDKRAKLASGLRWIFLSENPNEICNHLMLLPQEKRDVKNSVLNNEEIVTIIDKLIKYKCFTPTQHKKFIKNLIFYNTSLWNNISFSFT